MYIDYQKLLNEANIQIVRQILLQVQKEGLHFDHHFYISFFTDHPLVELSDSIKKQYPKEITIVMQHQFENLKVEQDKFSVSLSFNNIMHRLQVPFNALTSFVDPSKNFALQFKPEMVQMLDSIKTEKDRKNNQPDSTKSIASMNNVVMLNKFQKIIK